MRSRLWFLVAALIALGGFAGALAYLLPRVAAFDERLMRAVLPGSVVLTLKEAGNYTIYHEQKSVVDGRYYASTSADGLSLKVVSEATGAAVPLSEPSMTSSYSSGNRAGTSIFTFTIQQPGAYRLSGTLPAGRSEPKIVLAVEHGMMGDLFRLIGGTLAIVFGSLGVAGIIVIVTIWQRMKARRQPAA